MSERTYKLPDRGPKETQENWLERAAASIPAETIARALIEHFSHPTRKDPDGIERARSVVQDATCHGSGISAAIVRRFLRESSTPTVDFALTCNLCYDPACTGLTCLGLDEENNA